MHEYIIRNNWSAKANWSLYQVILYLETHIKHESYGDRKHEGLASQSYPCYLPFQVLFRPHP